LQPEQFLLLCLGSFDTQDFSQNIVEHERSRNSTKARASCHFLVISFTLFPSLAGLFGGKARTKNGEDVANDTDLRRLLPEMI